MRDYFVFAGTPSMDHDIWCSGWETVPFPSRDVETVAVPGRNGTLSLDNGRYENVPVRYQCYIIGDFLAKYKNFLNCLSRNRGYRRLEDTYHPDEYRMGQIVAEVSPEMSQHMVDGHFTVEFDCKPQRFLKSGERTEVLAASGAPFYNPTRFTALPLIRVYGTGTLTVGSETVQVTAANGYTDLDCDLQEAYRGSTNCNGNLVLTTGGFPVLDPGANTVTWTGFTGVEITPRWWML